MDQNKYRIVDISYDTVHTETGNRPFITQKSTLQDGTFAHNVVTGNLVGTHIEGSSHFYENGKNVDEYPVEAFMGRGILFESEPGQITREFVEKFIGDIIRP